MSDKLLPCPNPSCACTDCHLRLMEISGCFVPRDLEFGPEQPEVPGWYWNKTISHPEEKCIMHITKSRIDTIRRHKNENELWAGPIPEPKGEK